MKNIVLSFIFFVAFTAANAQTPSPPRPDTAGWFFVHNELLNAPMLQPGREAINILPNRQEFCFDLTLNVEMHYGGRMMQQAVFMNDKDGYIGFPPGITDGSGVQDLIMPELEDFNFMVFGFKGNAYRYFNRKNKQGVMEHYVSTGNTDMHKYQIADQLITAPLARKNIWRTFLDGTTRAMAYKLDGQPTTWYLFSPRNRYPENLHALKFFGGFGVGALKTREGDFMVMQMETGANSSTIKSISPYLACFDATGFKLEEAEFVIKRRADLDRERDRIARHAVSAANARTCRAEKTEMVNFERRELARQEQNLEDAVNGGNTYQDVAAQKGVIGMMDPLTTVQSGIYQERISICEYSEALSRNPSEETQRKLGCSSARLSRLLALEPQMRALDTQYASEPGTAYMRKSQLLAAELRNNCN